MNNFKSQSEWPGEWWKGAESCGKITHSHVHPNPAAHPNLDTRGFVITMLFANPIETKGEQAPQLVKLRTSSICQQGTVVELNLEGPTLGELRIRTAKNFEHKIIQIKYGRQWCTKQACDWCDKISADCPNHGSEGRNLEYRNVLPMSRFRTVSEYIWKNVGAA